jgi:hypothetical protein
MNTMLSPLGDYPHAKGLQRIDSEAIRQLVTHFNSLPARLGRLFVGVPFYIGHPDVPGVANEFPDKKAYGWVTELFDQPDGLYASVKWSKAGTELIQEGHYRFLSPFWTANKIGSHNGAPVFRPDKLISVGLTNNPNLPVLPLENTRQVAEPSSIQCLGTPITIGQEARIPTGFKAISPRLGGTSYPGKTAMDDINPEKVAAFPSTRAIEIPSIPPSPLEGERDGVRRSPYSNAASSLGTLEASPSPLEERVGVRRGPDSLISVPNMNKQKKEDIMQSNDRQETKPQTANASTASSSLGNGASGTLATEEILRLLQLPATATLDDIRQRVLPPSEPVRQTPPQVEDRLHAANSANLGLLTPRMERLENRLITVVIDNAISSGRIAPAQRGYWTIELANNFEEKLPQLANAGKALKTDARLENFMAMTEQRDATKSRKKQLEKAIKAKMADGLTYDEAWEEIKEENPGLFASMQQPEA